jgi:hypothetical protein
MEKNEIINYIKKDIPNTYFDSTIWEEDGQTHITIIVRTDPENLENWKNEIIKKFSLENTVFKLTKVVYAKQSPEEIDRLIEMSHSDADPGL